MGTKFKRRANKVEPKIKEVYKNEETKRGNEHEINEIDVGAML